MPEDGRKGGMFRGPGPALSCGEGVPESASAQVPRPSTGACGLRRRSGGEADGPRAGLAEAGLCLEAQAPDGFRRPGRAAAIHSRRSKARVVQAPRPYSVSGADGPSLTCYPLKKERRMPSYEEIFTRECLNEVFPPERTDQFFEALFGDAEDGAYDIRLALMSASERKLDFLFELHQRGDACLACNLTHGLPAVFLRHPVIDIKGVTAELARRALWPDGTWEWSLGSTDEVSRALHVIPLSLKRVD